MNKYLKFFIQCLATAIITGILVWVCYYIRVSSKAVESLSDKYLYICDAFTIPGVIVFLLGILTYIGNTGFFDGISYALGKLIKSLIPLANRKDETFYEYKERKNAKRQKGALFLVVTGAVFIAVAIVFLILFYQVYQPVPID